MSRKLIPFALCLFFLIALILPVSAASNLPMVVDNAGLLTNDEILLLEEKAMGLRAEYETDIVILTVESLEYKTAQNYADDYFDESGYGYGNLESGVLLLISMEERDWYISTSGEMIYALTDYGIQQLGESILWYLSEGEYFDAFETYLNEMPYYLDALAEGTPIDGYADFSGDFYHEKNGETVYYEQDTSPNFVVSLLIGIITATVTVLIMRGSMNTKRTQHSASGYLKAGSFRLKRRQDLFLYSNVSKVRRQQNNTSGGGGGSSVHRSSGGHRHGGGGGKF